jgi:hypothetical protein
LMSKLRRCGLRLKRSGIRSLTSGNSNRSLRAKRQHQILRHCSSAQITWLRRRSGLRLKSSGLLRKRPAKTWLWVPAKSTTWTQGSRLAGARITKYPLSGYSRRH